VVEDDIDKIKAKAKRPPPALVPKTDPLQSYLLLLALSVHSIFEGIAIGVQSNLSSAIKLMLAVLVHKQVASLALGISFAKAQTEAKQALKMIVVFSGATPVGIALGMVLIMNSTGVVEGVFGALACGTFVYIALSEIIVEEFSITSYKVSKYFAYWVGIGIVCLLMAFDDDDDD
jgi:zinc transporter 1/2/3